MYLPPTFISGPAPTTPHVPEVLRLKYANRHGLIAGATGTGKTVTLQGMAESFSRAGVAVFLSDVKGDLSGLAQPSDMPDFVTERAAKIGFTDQFRAEAFPVAFWDIFGDKGLPLRTTISEMGPVLLARILELNDTQEGVLNIAFRLADEEGLLLLDLDDLQSLLVFVGEKASELSLQYGNVSKASIGAIQRKLLQLEDQDGAKFFGEPALDLHDFMAIAPDGRGMINILNAERLMQTPRLYATFLLWLLSELFEDLPEIGDTDKPKLVFFFDEAHLLFDGAPKSLLDKIEQVVKLIRSKGVGIYFVTQNPADIPEAVLSQLGNRVQHALRAFTPQQQKDIKLAAQTYRENPDFNVADAITDLGVGEALVSTLEKSGQPSIVQKTLIRPPFSRVGVADETVRTQRIANSPLHSKYATTINRESAAELLQKRASQKIEQAEKKTTTPKQTPRKSTRQTPTEAFIKSVVRTIGNQVGREIMRGIMGSIRR
ncbi:helicase HerA-like domain-containing protein [Micavibrio aeruginosavorus]|uniref:helicase HerA-like domain-containing protein n=1 Tax=Micavibrio aeruginosavorus TaxID=349221 RepID=UPI002AA2B3CA|nr:helicase HerA-like domain-containing protein [Micavibrio aeruginosavorus]